MRGGQGAWREAEALLLRQGLLVAGCTPECDVVVSEEGVDEGVSCEHAWLRVEGLLCYLRDGGSTHGAKSATRTRLCPPSRSSGPSESAEPEHSLAPPLRRHNYRRRAAGAGPRGVAVSKCQAPLWQREPLLRV